MREETEQKLEIAEIPFGEYADLLEHLDPDWPSHFSDAEAGLCFYDIHKNDSGKTDLDAAIVEYKA
jgi:hypothetical protein